MPNGAGTLMRVHARARGRVQGVGYRYFVVRTAQELALTGWVINCSNGDVEIEAQGGEIQIRDFLGRLETGQPWARVDRLTHEVVSERKDEDHFELRI